MVMQNTPRVIQTSTRTRRPCVSVARQPNIPSARWKVRIGATHFLTKRLPEVATEMALHVLAYNLTRVMNIMGIRSLIAAMGVLP